MILYFSGTGNSQYVANKIKEEINDDIVSINKLIKYKNTEPLISNNRPFVFVCPIYAWRIPRVMSEFINTVQFSGSNEVYFIMTCGDDTSNAISYIKKLCIDKNWKLKGIAEIVMPENYIALFPTPNEETVKTIVEKSNTKIHEIALGIRNKNDFIDIAPSGLKGKLKSGIVNDLFYKFYVNAKGFHYTEQCIGCGKCVKLCPLNNINLNNSRPKWGNNCTHCMACISYCPTEAIEYKNKTQGKTRYYFK